MRRLFLLRIRFLVRDNRGVLAFLFLWFVFGFLMYRFATGLSVLDAARACVFYKHVENDFTDFYGMWTQGIIFGFVFSLLYQNVLEKYNPERSCRMLARELNDHVVVIGYSHLGRRLVNHFRERGVPYCVIERNSQIIDELMRAGEPVLADDALSADALTDANVAQAKAVLVVSNNLETALLVTKRVREQNAQCLIFARCFRDEFVEILEALGANEVISSSKDGFQHIVAKMEC